MAPIGKARGARHVPVKARRANAQGLSKMAVASSTAAAQQAQGPRTVLPAWLRQRPLTAELTHRLLDQGLRRFTFENVWAYSAQIRDGRTPLPGVILGEGTFSYLNPPFDPARVILNQSEFSPQTLIDYERRALQRGHVAFRNILRKLGTTGEWDRF